MKRLLFVAAICMVAAPALADFTLLPAKAPHYATFHAATGELTPTPGPVRYGDAVWSSMYPTDYFWGMVGDVGDDIVALDWGDSGAPSAPNCIDGFKFWYQTDLLQPATLDVVVWFYGEENGWNSYNHVPLQGFIMPDLPGQTDPPSVSWLITVDLEGSGYEFLLNGSDMDMDGLVDFGYTYFFQRVTSAENPDTGPVLAVENPDAPTDPNIAPAPGIEDALDIYALDMNDPNAGLPGVYLDTGWFNGNPFAQMAMELYAGDECNAPNNPTCNNPGDSGKYCFADIDCGTHPCDCVVGLPDLAMLLSNYGMTTGATQGDGDLEPAPPNGDGDVDLGDLAELLSQYGDDCR
jgi:hypothetical protein